MNLAFFLNECIKLYKNDIYNNSIYKSVKKKKKKILTKQNINVYTILTINFDFVKLLNRYVKKKCQAPDKLFSRNSIFQIYVSYFTL